MNATVTHPSTTTDPSTTSRAIGWGVGIGAAQAAIALAFWWLPLSTVHALMITLIAAVYVGFAVSDGRTRVIAVEVAVVVAFFVAAAAAVVGDAVDPRRHLPRARRQGPVAAPAPVRPRHPLVAAVLLRRRHRRRRDHRHPDPPRRPVPRLGAQPTATAATNDVALSTIASPS